MADNVIFNSKVGAKGFTVNRQAKDYKIGESIYLNVNNIPTEFLVVHQGKPSSLYDDSCNGTWLLMKDCYTKMYWDEDYVNAYADSDVHPYLNGTFLGLLDADVQSAIKQIKLPYCVGNGDTTIKSGANGLDTKVFLLGGYEIGWTEDNTNEYLPIDGAKLDYFTEGSGWDVCGEKIAGYDGSLTNWWLRSPWSDITFAPDGTWCVTEEGRWYRHVVGDHSYGIRPTLVLPFEYYTEGVDEVIHAGNISEQSVAKARTLMPTLTFNDSEINNRQAVFAKIESDIYADFMGKSMFEVTFMVTNNFGEIRSAASIYNIFVNFDTDPYYGRVDFRQISGPRYAKDEVYTVHPIWWIEGNFVFLALTSNDCLAENSCSTVTILNVSDNNAVTIGKDIEYRPPTAWYYSNYLYLGDPSITEAQAQNLKTFAVGETRHYSLNYFAEDERGNYVSRTILPYSEIYSIPAGVYIINANTYDGAAVNYSGIMAYNMTEPLEYGGGGGNCMLGFVNCDFFGKWSDSITLTVMATDVQYMADYQPDTAELYIRRIY